MVIAEALRGSAWARGMTGCMGYGVWLVRKERKESGGAFWVAVQPVHDLRVGDGVFQRGMEGRAARSRSQCDNDLGRYS